MVQDVIIGILIGFEIAIIAFILYRIIIKDD